MEFNIVRIMGTYINKTSNGVALPTVGKAAALIEDGARVASPVFQENLICVVENGIFDAALYVETRRDFETTQNKMDTRKKIYLTYDKIIKKT